MPGRRKWLVFFGLFGGIVQTHEWCRCQLLGRINSEEKQFGSPRGTLFITENGECQALARRSRRALPTTDTELKLIAAAAIMGLSNRPKTG